MIPTYEFLCECPNNEPIYLTYDGMMNERPVCTHCLTPLLPNLAYLRNLDNAKQYDMEFTPLIAEEWLQRGFDSFQAQVSFAAVQNYTNLMQHNRWVDATEDQGGKYVPIVRIEQTLMLGFNRLRACVQADHSFINTVIEVH